MQEDKSEGNKGKDQTENKVETKLHARVQIKRGQEKTNLERKRQKGKNQREILRGRSQC